MKILLAGIVLLIGILWILGIHSLVLDTVAGLVAAIVISRIESWHLRS